jgi:hypothetical protein
MTTAVVMAVGVFIAGTPIVAAAGQDEGRSEKQQDKKRSFHDSLLRLGVITINIARVVPNSKHPTK